MGMVTRVPCKPCFLCFSNNYRYYSHSVFFILLFLGGRDGDGLLNSTHPLPKRRFFLRYPQVAKSSAATRTMCIVPWVMKPMTTSMGNGIGIPTSMIEASVDRPGKTGGSSSKFSKWLSRWWFQMFVIFTPTWGR